MRPNLISCHLSVREHREKNVHNIVDECPTIVRKGCRAARVIVKNVWQQRFHHCDCILRRITACMFQLVGEDANEATIICWLPAEVRLPLVSGEENRLQGSSTSVCLDPPFYSFVHRTSPKSHPIASQIRVRQFNHDAANIFVCEEIVPRELHFIKKAVCVEKERIAAPTKEKTVVTGFRH